MGYRALVKVANTTLAAPSPAAPTSLGIGKPHDAFEQEADRVASEVATGRLNNFELPLRKARIGARLQRKCSRGGSGGTEGECEECKKKEMLQRRADGCGTPELIPPIVNEVLNSPGEALDLDTRAFFEPRFGYDFSRVRIHTDAQAAESAHSLHALAYTHRDHVVFASGRQAFQSSEDRGLLAHELTHVVQQSESPQSATVQRKPDDGRAHPTPLKTRAAETDLIEEAYGKGGLDEKQWHELAASASQKRGHDNDGAVHDYLALYRDAAKTAGAPGGDINVTAGASPPDHVTAGLNFALFGLDAEGSTACVNDGGKFAVKLSYTSDDLKLGVGIILGSLAFNQGKERTLAILRHEMMHAEHLEMALSAVRDFLRAPKAKAGAGSKSPEDQFKDWLKGQTKRGLSEVNAALIRGANTPHEANTELLAHVEGFMTHFHLAQPAPTDPKDIAFTELWGALDTGEGNPWKGATKEVKSEALGRLQEYYCHSLDRRHREAFDAWVNYEDREWRSYNLTGPPDADLDIRARDLALEGVGEVSKSKEAFEALQQKQTMERTEMPDFLRGLLEIIRGKCRGLETPLALPATARK